MTRSTVHLCGERTKGFDEREADAKPLGFLTDEGPTVSCSQTEPFPIHSNFYSERAWDSHSVPST